MDLSPKARTTDRSPVHESDDETARRIDDLTKDPEMSGEYVASHLDRALESCRGVGCDSETSVRA
jgi:hypothetical protein